MKNVKTKKMTENEVIIYDEVLREGDGGMRINNQGQIDWDWYEGKDLSYIDRKSYMRYWIYKKGEVILNNATKEQYDAKVKELSINKGKDSKYPRDNEIWSKRSDLAYLESKGYIYQYAEDEIYKFLMSNYNNEKIRRSNEFKTDALQSYGIEGHPKADIIFEKAWEEGHSSGLREVYNEMSDLVDLIK